MSGMVENLLAGAIIEAIKLAKKAYDSCKQAKQNRADMRDMQRTIASMERVLTSYQDLIKSGAGSVVLVTEILTAQDLLKEAHELVDEVANPEGWRARFNAWRDASQIKNSISKMQSYIQFHMGVVQSLFQIQEAQKREVNDREVRALLQEVASRMGLIQQQQQQQQQQGLQPARSWEQPPAYGLPPSSPNMALPPTGPYLQQGCQAPQQGYQPADPSPARPQRRRGSSWAGEVAFGALGPYATPLPTPPATPPCTPPCTPPYTPRPSMAGQELQLEPLPDAHGWPQSSPVLHRGLGSALPPAHAVSSPDLRMWGAHGGSGTSMHAVGPATGMQLASYEYPTQQPAGHGAHHQGPVAVQEQGTWDAWQPMQPSPPMQHQVPYPGQPGPGPHTLSYPYHNSQDVQPQVAQNPAPPWHNGSGYAGPAPAHFTAHHSPGRHSWHGGSAAAYVQQPHSPQLLSPRQSQQAADPGLQAWAAPGHQQLAPRLSQSWCGMEVLAQQQQQQQQQAPVQYVRPAPPRYY